MSSHPTPPPNPNQPQPPQQQNRRYPDRRPEGPRRVRHGLKLQGIFDFKLIAPLHDEPASQPAEKTSSAGALSERWFALASGAFERAALLEGHEYARLGQTVNLELQKGRIRAAIQGTAPRPYQVEIVLPAFDEQQWPDVIEAMSGEAVYVAKMLAGELPQGMDDLLAQRGLRLLPEHVSELRFSCTCSAGSGGQCKHAATAVVMTTERLHEHPLLIFTLLGMPSDQLLERLRRARTIQAKGAASAHGDAMIPESQIEPTPLEACLDDFWHSPAGRDLDVHEHAPAVHAPHALLRRLGPSPLSGKFPMVGLLASVYDTVAQAARKLADEPAAERENGKIEERG